MSASVHRRHDAKWRSWNESPILSQRPSFSALSFKEELENPCVGVLDGGVRVGGGEGFVLRLNETLDNMKFKLDCIMWSRTSHHLQITLEMLWECYINSGINKIQLALKGEYWRRADCWEFSILKEHMSLYFEIAQMFFCNFWET